MVDEAVLNKTTSCRHLDIANVTNNNKAMLLLMTFSSGVSKGLRKTKGQIRSFHLGTTRKGLTWFFLSVFHLQLQAFDLLFTKIMTKEKKKRGLTVHLYLMENYDMFVKLRVVHVLGVLGRSYHGLMFCKMVA